MCWLLRQVVLIPAFSVCRLHVAMLTGGDHTMAVVWDPNQLHSTGAAAVTQAAPSRSQAAAAAALLGGAAHVSPGGPQLAPTSGAPLACAVHGAGAMPLRLPDILRLADRFADPVSVSEPQAAGGHDAPLHGSVPAPSSTSASPGRGSRPSGTHATARSGTASQQSLGSLLSAIEDVFTSPGTCLWRCTSMSDSTMRCGLSS
jgi:hypothetical protein